MRNFEERRAKGESPDTLAHAEVVEENGEKYFRFMKGIVMPPKEKMLCLMCHGENIDAKVASKAPFFICYSVFSLKSHRSSIRHEPQRGLRAIQV